ncbi:MAG: hypothetical protein IT285_13895 [Bdellovibrionales bacterium]|nr:hypothetical protein [Bdellovibrionales bacterium]
MVTQEYRVEGPVMIFLTTTAIDVDEELLNRCLVLTVNEGREQTRAILERQRARETLEGLLASHERSRVLKLHQNAQRLIKPLLVANPFAPRLTFLDSRTRTRRDHKKYLTLIRTIALLHQYQRPLKHTEHRGERIEYIEVTPADIEIANHLCHECLGRSLDELPPQTRNCLKLVMEGVAEACRLEAIERKDYRFTRKQVRSFTGWSDFQVGVHLGRLVALEYVLVHRGGRGQSFVYELLFDGELSEGGPRLTGLIDAGVLGYDEKAGPLMQRFLGEKSQIEGSSSPHLAPNLGGSSREENGADAETESEFSEFTHKAPKNPLSGLSRKSSSYLAPSSYLGETLEAQA